jgi:hypothetical protein
MNAAPNLQQIYLLSMIAAAQSVANSPLTSPVDQYRFQSSSLSRKTPTERLRLRAARKAERQRKKANR